MPALSPDDRAEECLKTFDPSVRRTSRLIASSALFRTGISDPFGVCNGDYHGRRTPFGPPHPNIPVRIQGGASGVGELFGSENKKHRNSENRELSPRTSFYRFDDRLSPTNPVKHDRHVRKPPSLCMRTNAKSRKVGVRSGLLIDPCLMDGIPRVLARTRNEHDASRKQTE